MLPAFLHSALHRDVESVPLHVGYFRHIFLYETLLVGTYL